MGLDNGILIRGKTEKGQKFLNEYFDFLKDKYLSSENDDIYEIAYWRKCWNLRSRFGEQIGYKDGDDTELTLSQLSLVVEKVLKYFLIEENWEDEYGQSIWEWYVMVRKIGDEIYNIRRLLDEIAYAKDEDEFKGLSDEDFSIWFYDSY